MTACDVSAPMLEIAKQKAQALNLTPSICFVQKGAEDIPFESNSYDIVISAFVLRNIRHSIDVVLKGVWESLKPGGIISFVDLTEPDNVLMASINAAYLKTIVTLWGALLFRDREPIRYLRNSMKSFYRASDFVRLLEHAHFSNVSCRRFLFGIVTHYTALKKA